MTGLHFSAKLWQDKGMEKEPSERFKKVLEHIKQGDSVSTACFKVRWGTSCFYAELGSCEEFETSYLAARAKRAHTRFEGMETLADNVISGIVEPQAGRVVADIRKYQMAMENKIYNDKRSSDVTVNLSLGALVEASMIATAAPAIAAPDIIEHAPQSKRGPADDFL